MQGYKFSGNKKGWPASNFWSAFDFDPPDSGQLIRI